MKKYLFTLIALLFMAGCVPAQKAKADWTSIEQAAQLKNNKKLYIMDFYTSWCGWCKKMDADTFSDPTVVAILKKYYVCVKFDAEGSNEFSWNGTSYAGNPARNGRKSPHQFAYAILGQKMGFPTVAIFGADRKLMQALPGYYSADDFTKILWYFASGDYKKYEWERYDKIFNREIRPIMEKAIR